MPPPMILVIGPTGTGKTTFINKFLPHDRRPLQVGATLASVTRQITSVTVSVAGPNGTQRTVELVDTPGLNDTNIADSTSLKDICEYLAERKRRGTNLCGIIYFRSILQMRFTNTDATHQKLLRLLVGDRNFIHVGFLTTFWPPVTDTTYPTCESRERELFINFWIEVRTFGCFHFRFELDVTDCLLIINNLLDLGIFIPLVVDQLVNLNLTFELTGIGKEIWKEFESIKEEIRESKKELEELIQQISTRDKEIQKSFEKQREEFERSFEKLVEKQKELSRVDRERFSELIRIIDKPIIIPSPPPLLPPPPPPPPAQNQNCSGLTTVILQQMQQQQQQQTMEASIRKKCARKRRRDRRRHERELDDIYDEMDEMSDEYSEEEWFEDEVYNPVTIYNPAPRPSPAPMPTPVPLPQPWPC